MLRNLNTVKISHEIVKINLVPLCWKLEIVSFGTTLSNMKMRKYMNEKSEDILEIFFDMVEKFTERIIHLENKN